MTVVKTLHIFFSLLSLCLSPIPPRFIPFGYIEFQIAFILDSKTFRLSSRTQVFTNDNSVCHFVKTQFESVIKTPAFVVTQKVHLRFFFFHSKNWASFTGANKKKTSTKCITLIGNWQEISQTGNAVRKMLFPQNPPTFIFRQNLQNVLQNNARTFFWFLLEGQAI